ncbi:MAG: hypothetical protein ACXV9T_03110, partial [Methylobacter sp.]
YGGRLPISTYGYPQLIPSAWANTYIWLGTDEIEFFARGLMAAFPLAVISIFLDMYWRFRWPAALFAIALWCIALLRVFPYIADSGYVDVPVAFFVSLTGYLLFLGRRQVLKPSIALWLAAVTATGAVLTKQAGAIAVAMLVWGLLDRRENPISRGEWHRAMMLAIIIFLVLTLPWFGYKFYQIALGIDPSNVSYVTSDIYQGETLLARLWRATTITIPQTLNNPILSIYIPVLVLGVIALRSSLGRVCWLGVVLPYYLLWALFFSYDLRNFMPAVPFVCLGLGLGLQSLWPSTGTPLLSPKQLFVNMLPQLRWRSGVTLILTASVATLVLLPTVSRNDLITLNEQRHLEAEDPPLNKLLLNYAKNSESAGMIITTYTPVVSTPRLREHFFSVPAPASLPKAFTVALKESQPLCHILTMMPRHYELRYLLFHTNIYPEIINAAINDGSLRIIFQTTNARFFEIACSFNSNNTIKSDQHLTTFPIHHD